MIENEVLSYIHQPDTVKLNIDYDMSRPLIRLGDLSHSININYLTRSISWKPTGICIIDPDNDTLSLQIKAAIINTDGDLLNANINLISSKVAANEIIQAKRSLQAEALTVENQHPMDVNVEDYYEYPIGSIPLQYRTVTIIDNISSNLEKIYICVVGDKRTKYGYRFKTPKYIPDMEVHIYDKNNLYLGKTKIKETRPDNEVEMLLGESTLLTCVSTATLNTREITKNNNGDSEKSKIATHKIECKIRNNSQRDQMLLLRYPLGESKIVNMTCNPYRNRTEGFIEWDMTIPAGVMTTSNSVTFECTLETS